MRLDTVRKFALSLDDVTEAPHHAFNSFRVRGRIFVTVPPQGDALHVFVAEEDRERALALYPEWAGKLLWGGKVAGLRVALATAEPRAVKALVRAAHATRSAKR